MPDLSRPPLCSHRFCFGNRSWISKKQVLLTARVRSGYEFALRELLRIRRRKRGPTMETTRSYNTKQARMLAGGNQNMFAPAMVCAEHVQIEFKGGFSGREAKGSAKE